MPAREKNSPPQETRGAARANRLRHTLRYCSRFGLRTGMQISRMRARSAEPLRVQLPEMPFPLWVRPGTSDVATFDEVFVGGEYDLPFRDFAPRHILDLGANVGYAAVRFALRWARAAILAVEPATENMVWLKRNTGAYTRIDTLQAAVWSHPTEVAIANPQADANAFRMTESVERPGARVPALTVAQLIDRLSCERLDLLKMDVEGAEAQIFQGAFEWLDRVNVLIVELHDRIVPGCAEALYGALHGRHFRQEIVGQNVVIDLRRSP